MYEYARVCNSSLGSLWGGCARCVSKLYKRAYLLQVIHEPFATKADEGNQMELKSPEGAYI